MWASNYLVWAFECFHVVSLVEKAIKAVFHGQVHIYSAKLLFVFPWITQTVCHKQPRSLDMNVNFMQSILSFQIASFSLRMLLCFLSPWRCESNFMIPKLFMLTRCFMKAFYGFTISSTLPRLRLLTSFNDNQALIHSYEMCESHYPRARSA